MDGEIRSAFLMTEARRGILRCNPIIETRIEKDGNHYVISGRKMVVVGRRRSRWQDRDPDGQDRFQPGRAHQQQSQILVPLDTPGIKGRKDAAVSV